MRATSMVIMLCGLLKLAMVCEIAVNMKDRDGQSGKEALQKNPTSLMENYKAMLLQKSVTTEEQVQRSVRKEGEETSTSRTTRNQRCGVNGAGAGSGQGHISEHANLEPCCSWDGPGAVGRPFGHEAAALGRRRIVFVAGSAEGGGDWVNCGGRGEFGSPCRSRNERRPTIRTEFP